MNAWRNLDPMIVYWWVSMVGLGILWVIYVIVSEREYWRGFKAGKRVKDSESCNRANR